MDKTLLLNAAKQLNQSDMATERGEARPQAVRQFNALLQHAKAQGNGLFMHQAVDRGRVMPCKLGLGSHVLLGIDCYNVCASLLEISSMSTNVCRKFTTNWRSPKN